MIRIKNTFNKAEIATLPIVQFPGRIFVIYTEADARKAVDYLNRHEIVGVDTETRPCFRKGQVHKVALLQISTEDTCFLFRLNKIGMPSFLQDFLTNDILKIGLSLRDDFKMLRRRKNMQTEEGNWIELQDYVVRFGIEDRSLQKIYANLFGMKISKGQRLSNWEAETFTEAQMQYAAIDAWACVKIYNRLAEMEETGDYEVIKVEKDTPKCHSERSEDELLRTCPKNLGKT